MNSIIKIILCTISTLLFGAFVFAVCYNTFENTFEEPVFAAFMMGVNIIFCIRICTELNSREVETVTRLHLTGFIYDKVNRIVPNLERLQTYFKQNQVKHLLKNSMVECRLIQRKNGAMQIYCKERSKNGIKGQLIKTKALNADLIATIWGHLQMNFNFNVNAYSIMISFDEYFTQSINSYPNIKFERQNEYCRMVLNPELSEIKCYQIWEKFPKCFYIKGEYSELKDVIFNFDTSDFAFFTYDDLIKQYKNNKNLEVLEENEYLHKVDINNAELEEINSLPGINIMLAKKIIKKREEINGFKSIEDVLLFAKVKPNIYKILLGKIYVTPMKISIAKIFNAERTIDL